MVILTGAVVRGASAPKVVTRRLIVKTEMVELENDGSCAASKTGTIDQQVKLMNKMRGLIEAVSLRTFLDVSLGLRLPLSWRVIDWIEWEGCSELSA